MLLIDLIFMITPAPHLSVSTNIWTMEMWIDPPSIYSESTFLSIIFLSLIIQLHRHVIDFRRLCLVILYSTLIFDGASETPIIWPVRILFQRAQCQEKQKICVIYNPLLIFLQPIISQIRKIRSGFLEHSETLRPSRMWLNTKT